MRMAALCLGFLLLGCNGGGESAMTLAGKAVAVACDNTALPFGGGQGSESDPYLICSVAQFDSMRDYTSSNFLVVEDLDFAGQPDFVSIQWMHGSFDGGNHTLKNLNVVEYPDDGAVMQVGVFGHTYGDVRNVRLENITVTGGHDTGSIVGVADNGVTIENVHVLSGSITGRAENPSQAGGIVGESFGVAIRNCTNAAVVVAGSPSVGIAGGIAASVDNPLGTFEMSNVDSSTMPTGSMSAGRILGGLSDHDMTVTDCFYPGFSGHFGPAFGVISGDGSNTNCI